MTGNSWGVMSGTSWLTVSDATCDNRASVTQDMIEAWSDTRMVIVDECSFASAEQLTTLEEHARSLKRDHFRAYGGLNIVYAGDFSQLEPPCKTPIYLGKECPAFHGLLNAFIELVIKSIVFTVSYFH